MSKFNTNWLRPVAAVVFVAGFAAAAQADLLGAGPRIDHAEELTASVGGLALLEGHRTASPHHGI